MKQFIFTILLTAILSTAIYSQSITNTLGTGGAFILKDANTNFLTVSQSSGLVAISNNLMLNNTINSSYGVIYKGTARFIHNYWHPTSFGNNTFLGRDAGNFTMTAGTGIHASNNTGLGYLSLTNLTTGYYNTSVGSFSLNTNTTGFANTALGYFTLTANTNGFGNTALGSNALYLNSTGTGNTGVGNAAGSNITTGGNNTALGEGALVPSATSSNQVRIGNAWVTYAGIQVAWTVTSDRKWKENIESTNHGLEFISKLNPVTYVRKNDEKKKTEFGLIAQEVEETLKEFNIENSGLLNIDDNGNYELRYNDLFAPIIKAIQDLKKENDELKAVNQNFQVANNKLQFDTKELKEELNNIKELQNLLLTEIEKIKSNNNEVTQVVVGTK
jgi:trimeric autotransporter adhesin